jgi:putative transposase
VRLTAGVCVVHLVRASLRYACRKYRGQISKDLREIYTAPTETAAAARFAEFEHEWGDRYPAIIRLWRNGWEQFTPFLAFPPQIRKIVYTTDAIESLNSRFRQACRRRGHFPDEASALKVLYLVIATPQKTGLTSTAGRRAEKKPSTR